jgi:hypothetical protein
MKTYKPLQQSDWLQTELESIASPEASRAKMPLRLDTSGESDRELTEQEQGFGENYRVLLAKLDHDTQSWKTCQISWLETQGAGSGEYSMTWPKSGTMQNGIAYQLAPLERHTAGSGCGLLPTPAARDWKGAVRPETLAAKGRNADTNSLPDAIEYRGEDGRLNPQFVEWLMGFPIDHTELDV